MGQHPGVKLPLFPPVVCEAIGTGVDTTSWTAWLWFEGLAGVNEGRLVKVAVGA